MGLPVKQIEKISKALGDKHRLNILQYISNSGGCAQCSSIQEVVDLAQPSVSHHIKILVESGLIDDEKEGRNHKYNLNRLLMNDYIESLKNLQCEWGTGPASK